jgi:glutaminyl-tRNA synthetase
MADAGEGDTSLPERLKEKVENVLPDKTKKQKAPKKPKAHEPKEAKPAVPKAAKPAKSEPAAPLDPDSMFKEGWLKGVRSENPSKDVWTRFPPEPNGYLHIGHSKAIAVNFGFARYHGGQCYLRFDDTNPEAEEEEYFTAIEEMVGWLGFKPYKVTHSSDNFQKLYDLAEELIKLDGAYACHCSAEEVKLQRGGKDHGPRYACPHRTRPIEESLTEFRAMKDGKYEPGEATLRMKQNLEDGNPQMWDLMAYRVLKKEHHRTKDQWKIYPTYDYTHCLCDSFEGITHSLCTVEFLQSRVSYEWLCDAVKVYKPMQREYGRLNVEGTITSKRKIAALVNGNHVRGYDDPRLYTLVALRRRGVPPGAILSFVNELGVSTAQATIQTIRFEQSVRKYLETTVPRLMLLLDPIPVHIANLPPEYLELVPSEFKPKDDKMGTHLLPFTSTVYIDRSDFREEDSKDFFRMAPGKPVGLLKVPYPIKATSFKKDESSGLITEIEATYEIPAEGETFKKPKAYIQWVGKSAEHHSPINAEVRVFHSLFKSTNPTGDINDLNPNSQEIFPNAMVEVGLNEIRRRAPWPEEAGEAKDAAGGQVEGAHMVEGKGKEVGYETVRFQGMRVAYFCMDKDSTEEKVVLNRIVSLKEDAGKAS